MANNHSDTEKRLWEAADQFRANSDLKSSEYAVPVLGLIFLRYADHRFTIAEKVLEGKGSGRRKIGKEDYQAKGVMYVPPENTHPSTLDRGTSPSWESMLMVKPPAGHWAVTHRHPSIFAHCLE